MDLRFSDTYAGTLAYQAKGKIFAVNSWGNWDTTASPEKYAHLFRLCDGVRPGRATAYEYHFTDSFAEEWTGFVSSTKLTVLDGDFLDRVGTAFEIGDWEIWEFCNAPEYNVGSRGGVVSITSYKRVIQALAEQKRRGMEIRSRQVRKEVPEHYFTIRRG